MSIDLSQFHQVFMDEAHEHLGSMEQLLLGLNINDASVEDLNAIFRAAHSIKGGSGTFGFKDIADLTHALETLLDKLRKQILLPTDDMISAFLECCDVLNAMLEAHQGGVHVDESTTAVMRARLLSLAEPSMALSVLEKKAPAERVTSVNAPNEAVVWIIELLPATDLFANGASFSALTEDLSALGELSVLSHQHNSRITWQLIGPKTEDSIQELFEYICSHDEVSIRQATITDKEKEFGYGFFVDESELVGGAPEGIETHASSSDPVHVIKDESVKSPLKPQKASKPQADSSIRVGVEKVDQLINLVGELVITRSMLAQSASHLDPVEYEAIHNGLVNLERNSRDLQESVMSIRMLPINFVFGRFPRVVRDLTQKMHKKVRLKLVGEETELDKGLIEKLADPLTHLLRNSIDHGIETPEVRLAAGKSEEGTITLSASHQGGSILVQIVDDGAGLNREKLLEKAREKNIPLSDNPSDKEVWQLIFAPGFSTAKEVTDVSGRGVGMDVVQRNIAEMKGQVEIESVPGEGTTIGLRLPLTLAILDGMTLRVGEEIFILPLTRILESLQPISDQLKTVSGQGKVVQIRGEYLPLIPLYDVLSLKSEVTDPEKGILVVVETRIGKVALFVDELIAQQQVVIKSIETHYRKVEGISGATIMGDGRVALILDIDKLARMNS